MNTFKDFKKYTDELSVNYYTWIKHLFTKATETIFPKWSYFVDQEDRDTSILFRCCERDIQSNEIAIFKWYEDHIDIYSKPTNEIISVNYDTPIDHEWIKIFEQDGPAVRDVILSVLHPLKIS